jgi:hypothetical protein
MESVPIIFSGVPRYGHKKVAGLNLLGIIAAQKKTGQDTPGQQPPKEGVR